MGLKSIEQTLQIIEKNLRDARSADDNAASHQWLTPIVIFTLGIKQRLDTIYKEVEHKLVTTPVLGPLGQTGKAGPPGQRGQDGKTVGATPVYIAPEQMRQLFTIFSRDEKLRERVERLKGNVEDLKHLKRRDEVGYKPG